ncbi:hypothetical protein [Massilia sp. BJB1822]|uniref:hypothetical protein n=1 Tax=Massilia sp. BJB1822 TaxID=2744470 RepID=UPI0015943F56|nr:hypothetical protein [Massilia sp. BJB1822]NVD97468.1 hypothetical protein [Massilia sp. BJB1822]
MNILDHIRHLTPNGMDSYAGLVSGTEGAGHDPGMQQPSCPNWPPDLFAIVGSLIEVSACYTLASPDRHDLASHSNYLDSVFAAARAWNADPFRPPTAVKVHWEALLTHYGDLPLSSICAHPEAAKQLLALFAIADEASIGMGWDVTEMNANDHTFAALAMSCIAEKSEAATFMRYLPTSLCCVVPPDLAIVLPKSITASVGCTIRSLSHHLALLPPRSIIDPSWTSSGIDTSGLVGAASYDMSLLLVPFPYKLHAKSFELSSARDTFGNAYNIPAYFKLVQHWLQGTEGPITGDRMAKELFLPLIREAQAQSGKTPNGIVLPECALSTQIAKELVESLADSGIEFLITGVLDIDPDTGKTYNRAQTFVIRAGEAGAVVRQQNKHHRWRLDQGQVDRYALNFDYSANTQWWEDIDVSNRQLPFVGLRQDMSITTLICEDLARADPAMNVIRAVGPNLVIALLMDGPQLAARWPGRYATVLAEDLAAQS